MYFNKDSALYCSGIPLCIVFSWAQLSCSVSVWCYLRCTTPHHTALQWSLLVRLWWYCIVFHYIALHLWYTNTILQCSGLSLWGSDGIIVLCIILYCIVWWYCCTCNVLLWAVVHKYHTACTVVSPCEGLMVSLPCQGKVAGAVTDAIDEEGGSGSARNINNMTKGGKGIRR